MVRLLFAGAMTFAPVGMLVAPLTASAQSEAGCFLKALKATFPHDARFCARMGSGPYRYYICKNGTWQVFSMDMQKDDPRCHASGIEPQTSDPF